MQINWIVGICLFFFGSVNTLLAQRTSLEKQSEELGNVQWYRDYDEALSIAKAEEKNVLILFQEVPGCATCRNYGHNVLSHPLMVEAIENLFVPLAIFNNKGGKDKDILTKFKEPTWNNPVVRIINSEEKNRIPRIAGDYAALTLCRNMKSVLVKDKKAIPAYLDLLELELAAAASGAISEQYFQMYCFWTGEKELGEVDGVLHTESGFMNGSEVVKVQYNPRLVDKNSLANYAKKQGFKTVEEHKSYRMAAKDIHYYLQQSDYRYLPLSDLQKTKINSTLGNKQSAEHYLSPQQLDWLQQIRTSKSGHQALFQMEFAEAWSIKTATI